ncbi:hypothetical protein MUP79_05695 [Candidatus Bathyarchaeota archaeon]|nr:hypothetical protein [Candidatus Bathyarchaeota archaeon]
MSSPKTCELCQLLDMSDYRGDWIDFEFPYHTHMAVNAIRAMVHPNCRCVLRWAGRMEEIHTHPLGLETKRFWNPSKQELERMTTPQFNFALRFLRNPWKC